MIAIAELITGFPNWLSVPLGVLGWLGGLLLLGLILRTFR